MEQVNNGILTMLQTMTNPQLPQVSGGKGSGESGDFQKMLDDCTAQSTAKQPAQEKPKAENSTAPKKETAAAQRKDSAPAQEQEDPVQRVKKLAEQGYVVVQPSIAAIALDGQVYQPGEYVEVLMGARVEIIPVAGLDEAQMQQLQQIMETAGPAKMISAADPEGDAILEATDPNMEHSPVELLQQTAEESAGQAVKQAVQSMQPQEESETKVEVTDAEQAPRPLFRDVETAPIKVGEAPAAEQAKDVGSQLAEGLTQALAQGETRVELKLNPDYLGSVTVEITRTQDGALHVALSAESSQTRGLLEKHAGELQTLLAGRQQQDVQVEVQRQQESQQGHNHSYDGHNGANQNPQQEQQRRRQGEHGTDFMQQLRLGLYPMEDET